MQIISRGQAGGAGYQGPIWTIRTLFTKHGPSIFYRGLASLALRDTIGYGFLYSAYFGLKERTAVPAWLCGGISGVIFYVSTLPIDRCKTIVMTQDFAKQSKAASSIAAFKSIYKTQGLLGFYRGCEPTLLRTFFGQAVALTTYDYATKLLSANVREE